MQYQEYLRTVHYQETRKTPDTITDKTPDNDALNYDFWPDVLKDDGTYRKGPKGDIHDMVDAK